MLRFPKHNYRIRRKKCEMIALKVRCPDCDLEFEVPEDATKGEIVSCPDCGLELEVKQNNYGKIELNQIVIEGEDWGE